MKNPSHGRGRQENFKSAWTLCMRYLLRADIYRFNENNFPKGIQICIVYIYVRIVCTTDKKTEKSIRP